MDIIFDVDGTLLDITHRLYHIKVDRSNPTAKNKNWEAFRNPELKKFDTPIRPVVDTMNSLFRDGHRIIICSGRTWSEKDDTMVSLSLLSPYVQSLPTYFRSNTDYRPDTEMKFDALAHMRRHGYNPVMAFDDRPSVIKMLRDQGIIVADVGKGVDF